MSKQIDYPADVVDSNGKVWPTVGENIRNGKKSLTALEILKCIYNKVVYCTAQSTGANNLTATGDGIKALSNCQIVGDTNIVNIIYTSFKVYSGDDYNDINVIRVNPNNHSTYVNIKNKPDSTNSFKCEFYLCME